MTKKSKIFIITGLLFLIAALLLIGYNLYTDSNGGKASQEALGSIESRIEEARAENEKVVKAARKELEAKGKTEIKIEEFVKPTYVLNPDMEMKTVVSDGHDYIGTLEFPSLVLRLPVISEWSYPNLKIAPCRYTGTVYQNNIVIAGHNYQSHFGKLTNLSYGDEITFTDVEGNQFVYTVIEVETLQPTQVEQLITGDWDLTLFTCNLSGLARVTIRCELSDTHPAGFALEPFD